PLVWKTEVPIWVDQWPLSNEKLQILNELVNEQLDKGHLQPSTSPWNTPVFVIKKSSGSWRLLQDLRKVNDVLEPMGPLQQGMPSPTMLPAKWPMVVMDIKDCFFHIYLKPNDSPKFAFSVPSVNSCEPHRRFEWKALPQGMKNSPTLCQLFVSNILSPVRQQFPHSVIFHYMDDILICAEHDSTVQKTLNSVISALSQKIQKEAPWKYLGWKITNSTITPQSVTIKKDIKTLNDLQKLLGSINWIRPVLGITTDDLHPLFELLKGDPGLSSPRSLTPAAETCLKMVETKILENQSFRKLKDKAVSLVIFLNNSQPVAVIGQFHKNNMEFCLWEWLFLPHQFTKTIVTFPEMISKVCHKGRMRCLELMGDEPHYIYLPLTSEHFEQLLQHSTDFQIAICEYKGKIKFHVPACRFLQGIIPIHLQLKVLQSLTPIKNATTVFTDGSGKTGNAVVVWRNNNIWQQDIHKVQGSSQLVELSAVVRAFQLFHLQPLNIVSDSSYVVGIVQRIENSYLKHVTKPLLFTLLNQLYFLIHSRTFEYYITHTRSHTALPGP
ncbi:PO113 protein, partial [Mionectes macconnelli]|nr:PO113 protein [Mionectes macconnelli]